MTGSSTVVPRPTRPTACAAAVADPGTFGEADLATYAQVYTGRQRLRGGFDHCRPLLDDGRDNRALLAPRKLPMPVLAIATTRSGTAAAQALKAHPQDVCSAVAVTGRSAAEEDPTWFTETVTGFLAWTSPSVSAPSIRLGKPQRVRGAQRPPGRPTGRRSRSGFADQCGSSLHHRVRPAAASARLLPQLSWITRCGAAWPT